MWRTGADTPPARLADLLRAHEQARRERVERARAAQEREARLALVSDARWHAHRYADGLGSSQAADALPVLFDANADSDALADEHPQLIADLIGWRGDGPPPRRVVTTLRAAYWQLADAQSRLLREQGGHAARIGDPRYRAATARLARGRLVDPLLLDQVTGAPIDGRAAQDHALGGYPRERIEAATERHARLRPLVRVRTSLDHVAAVLDSRAPADLPRCHIPWRTTNAWGEQQTCGSCGATLGSYDSTHPSDNRREPAIGSGDGLSTQCSSP